MTKYTIMTELVKAGCDLDKLPASILDAIESLTNNQTPVNSPNTVVNDLASVIGDLLEKLSILSTYDFGGHRYAQDASDYVAKGDYKRAQREIRSISINIDDKTPDNYKEAYYAASKLIGQAIILAEK